MSEAALAQSPSLHAPRIAARGRWNQLTSLEALERGFALFRSTFVEEGWRYYLGSAPLVFCFIPMWVVNGQIRLSGGNVLMEAALLAAAYLLRVWMIATYMQRVRERAFGVPAPKPAGASAQAAAVGRLLAWKITLSAGALVALVTFAGASWFYSACQFASLEAREDGSERHSMRGCLVLAGQWFGDTVLLFLMLFPFWIVVWLNSLIIAMVVPQLLHSILGVNTLLSTPVGIFALIHSSAFWLSLFAGAWLALDPIVKCTFVIVYQHLRSRREGDDLRGLLASLPREQQKKAQMIASATTVSKVISALVVLAAILCGISQTARAQQTSPAADRAETLTDSARQARVQRMRQALDTESQRAIYRWHDAEHPSPPNWFDKLLAKIGDEIERAWNAFKDFLRKLWPRGLNLGSENGLHWQLKDLRLWLWLIAILTLVVGGVLFWLRRRKETASLSIPQAIEPLPDLSDGALASVRSEDEWFALARRLEVEGELRLALRAAYFGLLAGLAQREWLTIRRDRTNREYLDEFTRRWRRRPQAAVESRAEIPEKLRGSLRQFDRVWYGSYMLTPNAVAAYRQDQRELLSHV
ncbi:MAG TPA: hypothetical protein VKR59_04525 [Terriglobales bacterium]|nr:hypothetical protein [Terriglobales bacterium]